MQRKQKVARNYKRLATAKKVIFYLKVQGKMSATGSPFANTSLVYTYALGLVAINAITTALNAQANGGNGTTDSVTKAVEATEKFIDYWADIVDLVSGGDPVVIVSSGFAATKGETSPGAINVQPILDFTPQKQAGSVLLHVKEISITTLRPTITYILGSSLSTLTRSGDLIYCTDPTVQLFVINGKKDTLVTGLPSGKNLECICVITNSAGVSTFSNMVPFSVP